MGPRSCAGRASSTRCFRRAPDPRVRPRLVPTQKDGQPDNVAHRMRGIEPDLVRRAQSGDHDAFAIVVEHALGRLYGTARLILLDETLALSCRGLGLALRSVARLRVSPDAARLDAGSTTDCPQARPHRRTEIAPNGHGPGPRGAHRRHRATRAAAPSGSLTRDERTILALAYFAEMSVPDASDALGILPAVTGHVASHRARRPAAPTARHRRQPHRDGRPRMALSAGCPEAAPPDCRRSRAVLAATHSTTQRRRGLSRPAATAPTSRRTGVRPVGASPSPRDGARVGGRDHRRGAAHTCGAGAGGAAANGPADGALPADRRYARRWPVTLDDPVTAVLSDGRVLVVGLGDGLLGGIVYDPATGHVWRADPRPGAASRVDGDDAREQSGAAHRRRPSQAARHLPTRRSCSTPSPRRSRRPIPCRRPGRDTRRRCSTTVACLIAGGPHSYGGSGALQIGADRDRRRRPRSTTRRPARSRRRAR